MGILTTHHELRHTRKDGYVSILSIEAGVFRDRGQWTVDRSTTEFQDSLPRVLSAGSIEAGAFRLFHQKSSHSSGE